MLLGEPMISRKVLTSVAFTTIKGWPSHIPRTFLPNFCFEVLLNYFWGGGKSLSMSQSRELNETTQAWYFFFSQWGNTRDPFPVIHFCTSAAATVFAS